MSLTIEDLISFLQKWQTLIGAFIGGILGLLVAWIVARDARRREERAAAMLLITDLHNVRISSETLDEIVKKKAASPVEMTRLIAEMLSRNIGGLSLSPLFESSMVRIMPLDDDLAAHLALFKRLFILLDATLSELKGILEAYRMTGKVAATIEQLDSQVQTISRNFRFAVEHAACAEHLIDKLILRRTAPFYRIARRIPLIKYLAMRGEKPCRDLLRKDNELVTLKPPDPS
jgi:hypothetical protein